MAATTTSALQAAINTILGHDVGSPDPIKILQEDHDSATYSRWYCEGNGSTVAAPETILGERAMWCRTTVAGNDAAQAAEIIAAMTSTIGSIDGNVDPDVGP
jgi:hypothetical protein